ncbi:acyltransferase family protein [Erythrobacter sp. sf7]|uniref:Acyltransferase family protein n=1 Tax=Erythrobacter fulvus TaxID=2987523 RepID=A0ABT5JRB1_9SPHN|nr:acyltransferase family protein [Erythrobacter fulvus]MDC8754950.1 acyltransferase family protein [Erythrobacter fulvus]
MTYRPDIDGLRTLAVLLVLVFHFDLLAIGKAGFIGVDIFFVISGFLITTIIRRALDLDQFRIRDFLYRRVRRLYPALLATLVFTLSAGSVLLFPYRFEELATQTLLSLLYVVNFYFWQKINYFGLQAGDVPLLHIWSLAIEEQFYFVFPIVCAIIWRLQRKLLAPLIIIGAAASFSLAISIAPLKPEFAFYLLPTRAWELLLGSMLALAVYGRKPTGRWLSFMGPSGLVMIAVSVWIYGPMTQVPGYFSLLPTLGAVALILGGYSENASVTRLMASSPMVWIGKLSYPLYLVHWPILIFIKEHAEDFAFNFRIFGFLGSFLAAAVIYYFVEQPIRQGKVIRGEKSYLTAISGSTVGLIAISIVIMATEGVPARFSSQEQALLAVRDDKPIKFSDCERLVSTVNELCRLGDDTALIEVVIIGDSHAQALAGAFDIWLANSRRGGALAFHSGCMPVLGAGRPDCEKAIRSAVRVAKETPSVREVILVSIWRQALPTGGKPFLGRWVPETEVPSVFQSQLAETVSVFQAAGKKVTIVEPLFAAPRAVPNTLAGNLAYGRNWSVATPLAEHRETFATVIAAFDQQPSVRRISLLGPFCDQLTCRGVVEGRPLFTDNNHLAQSHSAMIAAVIASQADRPPLSGPY